MSYSGESQPIVMTTDGKTFEITPHLWQQNRLQNALLLRYFALPVQENDTTLWLGIASLNNLAACETFSFLSGKVVEPVLLDEAYLKELLQSLSPQNQIEEPAQLFYSAEEQAEPAAKAEHSDEPVIRLLDQLFESALAKKASDIHLEPQQNGLQIRFRIDGVLQLQPRFPPSFANRLLSRLKLLAKLDISETRLPQDGRFYFKTAFSDILDFRLSTLPTSFGEKAVLRLQQNKPTTQSFVELGMTAAQQAEFERALAQPQGLILVTGPTGSGKSITLYTALERLNDKEKHIMTAEDPIEIELDGIIQTQVNTAIGLDFARLLRTFLRQDPDIIMLGEIRDEESAAMALRAAQTGHLVLSTLHTNDAVSAVTRLRQLGISQGEIDNSLLLVIAQRLIRKKCAQHNPTQCDCFQGYKGRTGVYQFLRPNLQGGKIAYQADFADLFAAAAEKIRQGVTDSAEIRRVLGQSYDAAE